MRSTPAATERSSAPYQPQERPAFCSSSQAANGAKYSRSAAASTCRVPMTASSASGHGRLAPVSIIARSRAPASGLPKMVQRWSGPSSPAAAQRGAVELESRDPGEEIRGGERVGRNVPRRAGVEIGLAARRGLPDTLVRSPEIPPRPVVAIGPHFAGKDLPAPALDQQRQREGGNLVERLAKQERGRPQGVGRRSIQQIEIHQVRRRDRECDRCAGGFPHRGVGSGAEQRVQRPVRPPRVGSRELTVDRHEVVAGDAQAHRQAQVVVAVEVPRAGAAENVAVGRPCEAGALPRRWRAADRSPARRRSARRGAPCPAVSTRLRSKLAGRIVGAGRVCAVRPVRRRSSTGRLPGRPAGGRE